MAAGMTIGRTAQMAGVGIETIRFYERRGLIEQPPRPQGGGYRFYDDVVVERIRFIRQAQGLGFSLREIAELLNEYVAAYERDDLEGMAQASALISGVQAAASEQVGAGWAVGENPFPAAEDYCPEVLAEVVRRDQGGHMYAGTAQAWGGGPIAPTMLDAALAGQTSYAINGVSHPLSCPIAFDLGAGYGFGHP